MANSSQFCRMVRKAMEDASLSARQLALSIGVSPSYVTRVLSGERNPPSDGVIKKIARVLNIDEDKLFWSAGRIPGYMRTTRLPTDEEFEALRQFWKKRLRRP